MSRQRISKNNVINGIYTNLYLLFPSLINFIYKVDYELAFKNSRVYLDKPISLMKRIRIGENSSSSGILRAITFSPKDTEIEIGKHVRFGENCWLMLNTRHTPKFVSNHMNGLFLDRFSGIEEKLYLSHRRDRGASIKIGNDVWVGANVVFIGSLSIGDGSVVAAGSVVKRDVEPYSIVAGVPAKPIRYRFDERIRNALLRIKWWDWPEEKILDNLELFYDPDEFIKRFGGNKVSGK